jgi:sugar phosphate isomerase/epimerase
MSAPKLSVCQWTTYPRPFAEEVEAYRQAGVSGIGMLESKLDGLDDDDIRATLDAAGLRPTACISTLFDVLPGDGVPGPSDPDERVAALSESIRRFAGLGAVGWYCSTGGAGGLGTAEARRVTVECLRELARVAGEAGVELGLEPLSARFLGDRTLVTGVEDTIELIEEVGDDNLKLLFDVWHLWDLDGIGDQIRRHCPSFMSVVHIDDWRDPTRGWNDRALPGEGAMDLVGLLRALIQGGFDGWYDIEIISDDGTFGDDYPDSLWRREPADIIERARDGFLAAWREAERTA